MMGTTKQRNTTQQVLDALSGREPCSAAEVAERAGMGRSTAQRVLVALEADHRVRRQRTQAAGARRQPARWSLPASGTSSAADAPGKLRRGELAAMVADFVTNHSGEELSPRQVARALGGRSPGAVGNALDRLTMTGAVVRVREDPVRYRSGT